MPEGTLYISTSALPVKPAYLSILNLNESNALKLSVVLFCLMFIDLLLCGESLTALDAAKVAVTVLYMLA